MSKGRSKGKSNGGNDHRQRRLWPFAVGVAVLGVCVALAQSNMSLSQQPAVPMQRPPNLKKSRATAQTQTTAKKCRDADPSCSSWAGAGECDANPGFMLESCPVSCNACPAGDEDPACVRRNSTPAVRDRGIAAIDVRLPSRVRYLFFESTKKKPILIRESDIPGRHVAYVKRFQN